MNEVAAPFRGRSGSRRSSSSPIPARARSPTTVPRSFLHACRRPLRRQPSRRSSCSRRSSWSRRSSSAATTRTTRCSGCAAASPRSRSRRTSGCWPRARTRSPSGASRSRRRSPLPRPHGGLPDRRAPQRAVRPARARRGPVGRRPRGADEPRDAVAADVPGAVDGSPFWDREPTGLLSYRQAVYDEWPRTGIPDHFTDEAEYARFVDLLAAGGAAKDASYLWWAIRPATRFPTLELRICDACTRVADTVAIASLFRCLLRCSCAARSARRRGHRSRAASSTRTAGARSATASTRSSCRSTEARRCRAATS